MSYHDLEEKILKVLREADKPMRALDIGKALGFSTRREVNRVLYKMEGVKKIDNPSGPPLWQLATSTDPVAAQLPSESGACGRQSTTASQLGSQLSKISIGDETTATWNSGSSFLTTVEPTPDGKGLVLRTLSRDEVIRQGVGATSMTATSMTAVGPSNIQATQDGGSRQDSKESGRPVQETGYPNNSKGIKKPAVDPINLMKCTEVKKELEKNTGDNPGKKTECAARGFIQDTKEDSTPATTSKRKPKIAANFNPKKTQILEMLAKGQLDTHQVSVKLGMSTRVEAMQLLEELKRDGRVSAIQRDGVSIWSIKQ